MNLLSPEHLQLSILNASEFAKGVENAGAVFVGARLQKQWEIALLDQAMFCHKWDCKILISSWSL